MPAPTSPQTNNQPAAVSFARLKQSIRAAASRASSKQSSPTSPPPPSAFNHNPPSSPVSPSPLRQSQDSRISLDSSDLPATPSRSNSRLAFNISINPFRRSSLDLVAVSKAKLDKDADRQRKEQEKQRDREEKEKKVQQERERKARLAAAKKERTPMIVIPPSSSPPKYLWKPHTNYQTPTLSKGSMSSPDLTMRLRSGNFFDWEDQAMGKTQDQQQQQQKPKVSAPMPILPRPRLQSGPSAPAAIPLKIRTGAAASSSHLPLSSSPPISPRKASATPRAQSPPPSSSSLTPHRIRTTSSSQHQHQQISKLPNLSSPSLPLASSPPRSPKTASPKSKSSPPSSPAQRDLIRAAAYALLTLLARPLSSIDQRAEVEKRLKPLSRLKLDHNSSEERERRLFLDSVKDGFLLCVFINTLLPSYVEPLRPASSPSSPSKTRSSLANQNITSFLSLLQTHFQDSREDDVHIPAFLADDLGSSNITSATATCSSPSVEGIERVAKCCVAMGKVALDLDRKKEKGKGRAKERGKDGGDAFVYLHDVLAGGVTASTPNFGLLRDSEKIQADPYFNPGARGHVPSEGLGPPLQLRSPSSQQQQRKDNDRISVSTTETNTTYLSSLFAGPVPGSSSKDYRRTSQYNDGEDESKFGTVKTMTTEATSVQTEDGQEPSDSASITNGFGARRGLRPRRLSLSSTNGVDLGRVSEKEEDSSEAKTIVGRKEVKRPAPIITSKSMDSAAEARERIQMGKGRWPEDFEEVFGPSSPRFGKERQEKSADETSIVTEVEGGKRKEDETKRKSVDPELVKAILGPSVGVISGVSASAPSSPRRQLRVRRTSGSGGTSPIPPSTSSGAIAPVSRTQSPTSGPTVHDSTQYNARPLSPSRSANPNPSLGSRPASQQPHGLSRTQSSPPTTQLAGGGRTTTASKMPLSSSPPRIRPIPRNSVSPVRQNHHLVPKARPSSPASNSSAKVGSAPVLRRSSLQAREDLRTRNSIDNRSRSRSPGFGNPPPSQVNDSTDNLQEIMDNGPVPFPRRSSAEYTPRRSAGEHGRGHAASSAFTVMPTLPSAPDQLSSSVPGSTSLQEFPSSAPSPKEQPQTSSNTRPPISRGRFQSELSVTSQGSVSSKVNVKVRPSSFDEYAKGRGRTESMVNIGSPEDGVASIIRENRGVNGSALRKLLIVKEEGQSAMHYQLGNCIGRGQFGSVYRALNLNTGQTVAVKRITLAGLSDPEITQLMNEVDLLKRLSHPSIVKYQGMSRDSDTLNIVLEYVENGSLLHTLKAFGRLNERLVASYVIKILEGLHYLHQSQVVHCDLKAANILTTKNGNVKLSDFGVSLNLRAMEHIKSDVAGTPNWMAPEVIELKGASTASDIWSLGCTVIELLTGKPPYADIHNGMTVLFRIVDDDMPPLPEKCSDSLRDFLMQCFQKIPSKRPSAEVLFEHDWLKMAWGLNKDLRPQDSIPFLRRVSTELARVDVARAIAGHDSPMTENSLPPPDDLFKVPARRPSSGVDENGASGARQQHSFVKTSFSKAVICRVCQQAVKSRAVLCQDCSLIAHARCSQDAPATCDIRAQLLLYAQYSHDGVPPVHTPSIEVPAPGGSPPKPSETPLSSSPSGAFKIFSRKKSKQNYGDTPESGTPPTPVSSPLRDDEVTKRHILFGRGRTSDDRSRSRASLISSTPNTSSLRSAGAVEKQESTPVVANGVIAKAASSQGSATPNSKKMNLSSDPRRSSRVMSLASNSTELLSEPQEVDQTSPDDPTYAKRRKRLSRAESKSGCLVQ